ncbi:MAG: N-acetylmuramoyl-L-alanine amidase family protein [Anaerostipes sp.]|jgi:N-acetylmuramoyl-L-alanine amidase
MKLKLLKLTTLLCSSILLFSTVSVNAASSKAKSIGPSTRLTATSSSYNVRIKKPKKSLTITTGDDYNNRRLILYVKGNYKSYFNNKKNRKLKVDKYFRSYKVTYSNGYTRIYIRPRKSVIKAYSVTQTSNYIYVRYASPKSMYKKIVVVDAGHGGSDTGATGNGLQEKNLTLQIVQSMKKRFDKNSSVKVYYTRLSDWYPSLDARSALSNNVKADRFISVHINSFQKTSKGTETLYNSKGYKSSSGLTSYKWSKTTHSYILSATGFTNRGLVNRTGLSVLRKTKTASTLTEIGFITNPSEAKSMKANTDRYGNALYNSILNSFSKYPTKR